MDRKLNRRLGKEAPGGKPMVGTWELRAGF